LLDAEGSGRTVAVVPAGYSARIAITGSTRAARNAGIMHATTPIAARDNLAGVDYTPEFVRKSRRLSGGLDAQPD
jgi:hypothetical protein